MGVDSVIKAVDTFDGVVQAMLRPVWVRPVTAVEIISIVLARIPLMVGPTATSPDWGSFTYWMPKPWKPPVSAKEQTTDWRAECGRFARPVRKEEWGGKMRRSYLYFSGKSTTLAAAITPTNADVNAMVAEVVYQDEGCNAADEIGRAGPTDELKWDEKGA